MNKIISIGGHLYCTFALYVASLFIQLIEFITRRLVLIVTNITGIEEKKPKPWIQTYSTEPVWTEEHFLNEPSMLNSSDFPIKPAELIEKCKVAVRHKFGSNKPELLSEDFQFIFPVVGPRTKAQFVKIYSNFKVEEALTGSNNYFGFNVDPMEPNRVWFFTRSVLTHSGVFKFGSMNIEPSGKQVVRTPQVMSMSFNREGEVYKLTGGYTVDKTVGNTGGLGGVFGIIHAIGGNLPFPEGKPWKPSMTWDAFIYHVPAIMSIWKKEN